MTNKTTRWWRSVANVLCFPLRCCASRKSSSDATEETRRQKGTAKIRRWKRAIGFASPSPSRGVSVSTEATPSVETKTALSNVVTAVSNDVAADEGTEEKVAEALKPMSVDDDDDEDELPRPRRKHRDDPYASESKVKSVIVSRGDLRAERVLLLARMTGEGVRCRANSTGWPSRLVGWKPRADVFLADTRVAVDAMCVRLSDPSVRYRPCMTVPVPVPEHAEDQRPLYVERVTWKPHVSAFRTQNAFFDYGKRQSALLIVLNV